MDIAILGAGVAGSSAALALHQHGHRVRLYERRPMPATMGAGMVLWPNASFVLDALGLLRDVAEVSGRPQKMLQLDPAGGPLGGFDIGELDVLMGHGSYAILRRDLQALLLKHLVMQGIEVRFDRCAQAIEPGSDGRAAVHFASGHRTCADLIVGAEGRTRSVARRYVVGDNGPVYQGFVNWIGVAESRSAMVEDIAIYDYWGVGERFGLVPVTPRKVYWAAAKALDLAQASAVEAPKPAIEEMFATWAEPIGQVIRATPADAIRKILVHDLDPVPVWHRDNVLLIGDAAHAPLPTSGQGACQALEDAWHLARCLAQHGHDLAGALVAFTRLRSAKTAAMTERARTFARALFSTDPARCRARNEGAKSAGPFADVHAIAKSWGAGLLLAAAPGSTGLAGAGAA
jgi:FAD-dependent urate hydroxylase